MRQARAGRSGRLALAAMLGLAAMASGAGTGLAQPEAAPAPSPPPSPGEIVAAAPAEAWRTIAAEDLLVMDLAPDAEGRTRRVVIQLMPPPFSQGWVRNMRRLAEAHWWDGTSVNRVQDNYVVQWGTPGDEGEPERPLPAGLETVPESEYTAPLTTEIAAELSYLSGKETLVQLPDNYAPQAVYLQGWPLAFDGEALWPVHCYAMVGVGRNYSPDTGSGAELYTVIGHAPRHLDQNIAVVGRIVAGIEHLSSLPRGTGPLGFYEQAGQRVPIVSVRLASAMPEGERPRFEMLDTASRSFAAYADARQNRRDPFFNVPAGVADVCNIPVPVRPVAPAQ